MARHGADHAAHLEEEQRRQKNALYVKLGVELAEEQLKAARRQQKGGAVPAHVREGVEIGCDLGDGGCDDGTTLVGSNRISHGYEGESELMVATYESNAGQSEEKAREDGG